MKKRGLLLVISGPSGAGKGTICKKVLDKDSSISLSISMTTRSPRPGELHGENYFFVKQDEFIEMVQKKQLLEYANVYDNFYGTPRKWVEDKLKEGKDVLLEIDIQGALQIKEKFPECLLVFIIPPSIRELQSRLINRGTDAMEVIEKRLHCVEQELQKVPKYDYIIVNAELDKAVEQVSAILLAEKCRPNNFNAQKYLQAGGIE